MATETADPGAISLVNLFSVCVECFGVIHGGAQWDKAQHLELTKLGIEQARLLAWGDSVGICDFGSERNALLDVQEYRDKIEAALQAIIDRPAHTDRVTQFEKFGLKPPKRFAAGYEPALDFNRLEAFREKLYFLHERQRDGFARRGKSATIVHWAICDTAKFEAFVALIKEKVDVLIDMMDVRQRVNAALRHDIKAFGWHPVFERARASRDMSKLKMVKEVCKTMYPDYAAAADVALAQLSKEWQDNYESLMSRRGVQGSEIPGAANKMSAKEKKQDDSSRRGSWFAAFRPSAWRKHSKDNTKTSNPTSPTSPTTDDAAVPRSKSMGGEDTTDIEAEPLTHARSKSIAAIPMGPTFGGPKDGGLEEQEELDPLSQVPTENATRDTANLQPVTSMISRNDQFVKHHRASVA